MYEEVKAHTHTGIVEAVFDNTNEVKELLGATAMPDFFAQLKKEVDAYYEGN